MDYSRRISERLWNIGDKGELESKREETFIDDIVQKSHISREILANLEGVTTVFDGGAGSGRFSIMLARLGKKVTHFDISEPMIEKARQLAEQAGVSENITFVKGALEELTAYADRSFDMVMSFDAPVSYTYPYQEKVIGELVRIAKKKILISVSSRLGTLPYVSNPLQKNQFILNKDSGNGWVRWCVGNRQNMIDSFVVDKARFDEIRDRGLMGNGDEEKAAFDRGEAPWPITYLFMPDELKEILESRGVKNVRLAGPGAYARTIPNELLVKIMNDSGMKRDFLDMCYEYDRSIYVCGMGKDNLLAAGDII